MSETIIESTEDFDEESPSSIKQGAQRYFILAGVLTTLLFVYLFVSMSMDDDSDDNSVNKKTAVPEQLQEADINNPSSAVAEFNRSLEQNGQAPQAANQKVVNSGLPDDLSPRKTASNADVAETQDRRRQKNAKPEKEITIAPTPFQKFQEQEELRAMRSLASLSSLGDDSAFYGDETQSSKRKTRSVPTKKNQTIEEKQTAIRQQISEITAYREAIERGDINPSTPPPSIQNLMRGDK
tara:strand:- start:435 stop:1151 length:717 start_codon:yes stop_codon:yes gene_type:complete